MAKPFIYGIKNCDTMKKTFVWFDKNKIAYDFHDYKKEGADKDVLLRAIEKFGWEEAINRKGTSWRKLPEDVREKMTEKGAIKAALDNPSLIKRPIIIAGKTLILGLDETALAKHFK